MSLAGGVYLFALIVGGVADVRQPHVRREIGGYQVLEADFHVHMLPFGWAMLSPWDTVIEADRRGLDVVALTPHQQVWPAKVGEWWARHTSGLLVIVGEEITAREYHMIAVGISEAISSDQSAARAIDAIHRQRGIAIAAHPYRLSWPAYDEEAMRSLDGVEVVRPESVGLPLADELHEFAARASSAAPIASSDYHGLLPMGTCRTFVFARGRTVEDVLTALRERRVVVFDTTHAYGDPELIRLAAGQGLIRQPAASTPGLAARAVSGWGGLAVLLGVLLFNPWRGRAASR